MSGWPPNFTPMKYGGRKIIYNRNINYTTIRQFKYHVKYFAANQACLNSSKKNKIKGKTLHLKAVAYAGKKFGRVQGRGSGPRRGSAGRSPRTPENFRNFTKNS